MDDKKEVLQNKLEKKRIQTEIDHLEKARKSGIVSQEEYISVKRGLDRKIKDMDKKLRQVEAKQKAVEEILGAKSVLTVAPKKHQKYFTKINNEFSPNISSKVVQDTSHSGENSSDIVKQKTAVSEKVLEEPVAQPIPEYTDDGAPDTNWRFALVILTLFLIILLYIKFTSYDNTPVVIDAYLDYASQYSKDTYTVLQQLSAESSSLIVTYHLVGTSEQSVSAAHAFFCAAQQGREKEYLNYIFTTETDFETAAQTLGLDTAQFGNCIIEPYTSDADEISYTPTIFVNDNKIVGAVGYETIKRVVENEMN
jgi:hypothetical protein